MCYNLIIVSIEALTNLNRFKEFDDHQAVYRFEDSANNLRGFIEIHNDNLGPATGGTRMFPYASEDDALRDVLRLSRAMTYKCALAGVRHGGGKAVIIGDPDRDKNEALLRAYASVVNELKGSFTTGEDSGITEDDVQIMLQESRFFNGRRGIAGDPSPYAALTTFLAMREALKSVFGNDELSRKIVAVKGIGKAGANLVKLIINSGAKVIAADIKEKALTEMKKKFPTVSFVNPKKIHMQKVHIFAPCALGDDITGENINEIQASIICGVANNQLSSPAVGEALHQKKILYIPDYVANCGGLINVIDELEAGGYNKNRVMTRIQSVSINTQRLITQSRNENQPTHIIADRLADKIFSKIPSRAAVV